MKQNIIFINKCEFLKNIQYKNTNKNISNHLAKTGGDMLLDGFIFKDYSKYSSESIVTSYTNSVVFVPCLLAPCFSISDKILRSFLFLILKYGWRTGVWSWDFSQIYCHFYLALSQFWALVCLNMVFHCLTRSNSFFFFLKKTS